jgi:hypothetical protein
MENLKGIQQAELQTVQQSIDRANEYGSFPTRLLSDGYHTFDELYEFRKMYNAVLFNEWANLLLPAEGYGNALFKVNKYDVHKSWKHSDGEECFGGGWFIVSAKLPTGLISNHYKTEDWDLFKVPEVEQAKYEYDGHTAQDVLIRLKDLV